MYKYYVYGHYTDDGELFYIGKGTGDRAYMNGRNSVHDRIAKMYGCNVKILLDCMNEEEALFIENEFMRNAYERKIILTNADYVDLNEKPTDDELLSFVKAICLRNDFATNSSLSIIELEGSDNFNPKENILLDVMRLDNENLITLSEVRPYQLEDNIDTLTVEQAKIIYALGNVALLYCLNDIKIPFDWIDDITKINLEEEQSYKKATNTFASQSLKYSKDNFFIEQPTIISYYISPLAIDHKYVWVELEIGPDTIDSISTLQIYLNKIFKYFTADNKELHKDFLDIYDKINCHEYIIDYFDKGNR